MNTPMQTKFLHDLIDLLHENPDINLYKVIGDIINGSYEQYCSKEVKKGLETEYNNVVKLDTRYIYDPQEEVKTLSSLAPVPYIKEPKL